MVIKLKLSKYTSTEEYADELGGRPTINLVTLIKSVSCNVKLNKFIKVLPQGTFPDCAAERKFGASATSVP